MQFILLMMGGDSFKRRHCTEHYYFLRSYSACVLFHDPSAGKKSKRRKLFTTEIKPGDRVITISGVHGKNSQSGRRYVLLENRFEHENTVWEIRHIYGYDESLQARNTTACPSRWNKKRNKAGKLISPDGLDTVTVRPFSFRKIQLFLFLLCLLIILVPWHAYPMCMKPEITMHLQMR